MLAYRLISGDSLLISRSFCPKCKTTLNWYDNIPIISFFLLKGKCRSCKSSISLLYVTIELLSALFFFALVFKTHPTYWPLYFLFFSALLVTIRTDLETMLISRFVSLYLIPVGLIASAFGFLPITFMQSIIGTISAYCCLFLVGWIFYKITNKVGLGQGDVELLAFIGSFLGITGWWFSLLIGSLLGSLIGIGYMLINGFKRSVKIPFGPFLALGAIIYVLYKQFLLTLIGL